MPINAQKISLAEQQQHANGVFPLVYTAAEIGSADAIKDWIEQHMDQLADELAVHGAILFRDFGVTDDRSFDGFIRAFNQPSFTYEDSLSNAVRRNRTELVLPLMRHRQRSLFFFITRWHRLQYSHLSYFFTVNRPRS